MDLGEIRVFHGDRLQSYLLPMIPIPPPKSTSFATETSLLRHDPVLIYGQTLGVILTAVVFYQVALYRRVSDKGR